MRFCPRYSPSTRGNSIATERNEELCEKKVIATTGAQLLENVGGSNAYVFFIMVSTGLMWFLAGLTAMAPAYMSPTVVDYNDSFITVQEDFHIKAGDGSIDPAELTSSIYYLGNMMFSQFLAVAADRIGRRPVLVWSLIVAGVVGVATAYAPSFTVLLIGRFIQGSFFNAITMTNWVHCAESVALSSHSCAFVVFGLCWCSGYCAVAPISMYFPNWRDVQLVTSAPSVVFGIILFALLPESLSYILANGKRKEAEEWIRHAERLSIEGFEYDLDKIIENETAAQQNDTFAESMKKLSKRHDLLLRTFLFTIIWTVDWCVYNGLSLTSTAVSANPHIAYVFSGIVEIPSYFIMPAALDRIGRKPTVMSAHLLGFLTLISMYLFAAEDPTVRLIIWLLGKFSMCCAYMCCFIYGAELFPIQYRNICMGACATIGNVGAMLAPHFAVLDGLHTGLSYVVFSILALGCSFIVIPLPETKYEEIK